MQSADCILSPMQSADCAGSQIACNISIQVLHLEMRACVSACVCVCACVCACMCACVRAGVRVCIYNIYRTVIGTSYLKGCIISDARCTHSNRGTVPSFVDSSWCTGE